MEHRLRIAPFVAQTDAFVHEGPHPRITLKIALDETVGLRTGNARVPGKAEATDAVDDAEVGGLRRPAHFRRDRIHGNAVDLRRRAGVDVLILEERVAHGPVAAQVRQYPQLDLAVVRVQ